MYDLQYIALVSVAFIIGGVLKGATGVGAPVLAVPVLALLYNVPLAVAVFVMPNIVSNAIQFVQYRGALAERGLSWVFAGAGVLGAVLGTLALARLPSDVLTLAVAFAVLLYVAFRLMRPDWRMPMPLAKRLAAPMGAMGGVLQGAAGISAPVSITFLNALKLDRPAFIATICLFFACVGLVQLPSQVLFGVMTWERFGLSCLALIPLTAGMPLGAWIGARIPKERFDTVILLLLVGLAAKMLWDYAAG